MPIFELQSPDGKTYEIDAPSMDAAAAAFQGTQQEPPSTLGDVAKSFGIGAARGAIGLAGLPGDIGSLVSAGADKIGVPGNVKSMMAGVARYMPQLSAFTGPGSQDIQKSVEGVTGEFYQPKTTAGEYARTVGEFLPAAAMPVSAASIPGQIAGRAVNVLGPALGSETAGQFTKGTSAEPYARLAGAFVGGVAGPRLITPATSTPERAALADVMRKEGVPLTAGQRTGSRPMQWMEQAAADTPIAGGKAAAINEQQGRAFTGAVLKRIGASGDEIATPEVIDRAVTNISKTFEDLSARNTLVPDQRFVNDLIDTAKEYVSKVIPTQRAQGQRNVEAIMNDVVGEMQKAGGTMPGTLYQATRSRLSAMAEGVRQSDPQLSTAIKGIHKALDGAMNRSIRPEDRQAWEQARKQWGNWRTIERASTGAGSQAAEGFISPSQLRNAVATKNRGQYARGKGDLAELARAGEALLKPLPQSGTAPRQAAGNLFASLAGMGAGGVAGGLPGAFIGAAAPALAGRTMLSRPVQAYLGNQAMPMPIEELRRNLLLQEILARPALEYNR